VYLLILGGINLARRPFTTSGTRDTAALGLAVSGMFMAGPFELFYPNAAAVTFGSFVWVFLAALYGLCLILLLLSLRPRLVVYNIAVDELRPVLAGLVEQLDEDGRWAGDSLSMPNLGVHLHIDSSAAMRSASLVSSGPMQSHSGWRKLESGLTAALSRFEVRRNGRAASLLLAGLAICGTLIHKIAADPQLVAQSMVDMFTR
jgi:hypothetical protein